MILDDKYIALNVSQCEREISFDMIQDGDININVTTCMAAAIEEGIFDESFDLTFE